MKALLEVRGLETRYGASQILFGIDLAVAYATRSMPQANVYFLSLPLKIGAGLLLLAMSLKAAPALVERLFRTALSDSAAVLGA